MPIEPNAKVHSPSQEHRDQAATSLGVGIITVSDTRTLDNDGGGALIVQHMQAAGFLVADRRIVKDERASIQQAIREMLELNTCDAVLLTGGTGVSQRDCTPEAVQPLLEVELPGYGEIFRMISFQEIGAAAMLSRATAGRVGTKVVMTMPGSPAGVRLALEKLIVPELAHLIHHARK
jgi:molybdenum cofactor biosynthesis protein B